MKSRTLILSVLLVALGWASGNAASWNIEKTSQRDGCMIVELTFTPGTVDTSDFVGVDVADNVNDSLIFYSPLFTVPTNWTVAWCKGFYEATYQDTTTTVDTIGYRMQTKCEDVSDSVWHQIAICEKADEDQINNAPTSFDMKAFADADSTYIFDAYRLEVSLIAEEAQWRLEASAANGGTAGQIPFNARYKWYIVFADKGNQ